MANNQEGSCFGAALVLGVVFMMGRCSISETLPVSSPTEAYASDTFATSFDAAAPVETGDIVANIGVFEPLQAAADLPERIEAEPEGQSVHYPNCSAARAVGAAPVYEGDPGYAAHLDRDNDGVGCE